MAPNDLLNDIGGFGNGLWRTLKFEEKAVLNWIGFFYYASLVDGRHHYESYMSGKHFFWMACKNTDCDRQEALHILDGLSTRL